MRRETPDAPDVLVVGLGPAGSRAATMAALAGLSVVALERRGAPGRPVQCAEFVPALLEQEVAGLGRVTAQAIARMLTFVEDGAADETPRFPGCMIDRAAFDRLLAETAARAGADCRYSTAVLAIEPDGTVHPARGNALRPRLIVGADGPRSRVGAATGRVNRELVETRQVTVPLLRAHDATDIFLRAAFVGGYGWLFPKGEVANLGLGVTPAARHRLKPLLAALHRELSDQGRVGVEIRGVTGGAIPVGGRLGAVGRLGRVPVLLAGDAAGLTNPVTGAGIAAAVQSGTLAGRAAADWLAGRRGTLDDYEEELHDIFDAGLVRALGRRRSLLEGSAEGAVPSPAALRASWIAYPQYWAL
jgi:digeranylgeranylglycerophospholipid reductase